MISLYILLLFLPVWSINCSEGLGTITAENATILFHSKKEGEEPQRQLNSFVSTGKTILTYEDTTKKITHTLTCYGKLTIDHEKLVAYLESPLNENGKVDVNEQVVFQDSKGSIIGDHFILQYRLINDSPQMTKITVTGSVNLRHNCAPLAEGSSYTILQYALADKVEFFPETEEIHLTAEKGNRVLFYDKVNNIQASATSLKIKRDQITKKEMIEGVGDVRFQFVERELEQIKNYFGQ